MATVYVDTSALARMLLDEPDSAAIERSLSGYEQRVASRLLQVELRRVGLRTNLLDGVGELLAEVALIPFDEEIVTAAETVPPATVGTLDAIHLATAVHLAKAGEIDALMTFDKRLAHGAREHGITVLSPS
jgi:predicted nucleic acid-binding protein